MGWLVGAAVVVLVGPVVAILLLFGGMAALYGLAVRMQIGAARTLLGHGRYESSTTWEPDTRSTQDNTRR